MNLLSLSKPKIRNIIRIYSENEDKEVLRLPHKEIMQFIRPQLLSASDFCQSRSGCSHPLSAATANQTHKQKRCMLGLELQKGERGARRTLNNKKGKCFYKALLE